ncbi:MAG: hypothetical protein CMO80_00485 [Verrucomicrobiales bacterium]|nr:hypothetical protein [Verrucomicrobiales bacterium]
MNIFPADATQRTITRRDLLRIGGLGAAGLALPGLLQAEAGSQKRFNGSAKNCIYIFLCGGPSQLDMWDMKPDAPREIRGPFNPISTNVPGIQVSELLPRTAKHADKFCILRSMRHDTPSHDTGILYTLLSTMHPPNKRAYPPTRQDHPGIGAALTNLMGAPGELPAWVTLPRHFTTGSRFYKGQTGGFLGPAYDTFSVGEAKKDSLGAKDLSVNSLDPVSGLNSDRIRSRAGLISRLDGFGERTIQDATADELTAYREKAFSMLSSDRAKQAFDLNRETPALRDRYGRNEYGQSFLMARRLVESGVRMVNVFWTFYGKDGCQFNLWDNHGSDKEVCGGYNKGFDMITAPYCCPSFDLAYSALLEDLHSSGLLDETLVVVLGEFGRTPKINKNAGRDHWPNAYSIVLAGGGVQGGQVYGETDKHAAFVTEKPTSPDDLGATIYHAFGIPPGTLIYDQQRRPIPLTKGNPVTEIFT